MARAGGGSAALSRLWPGRTDRLTIAPHDLRTADATRAAEIYAERFSDPDGRIRASFSIVWMSGWAPDASQQKPLKPGSARVSLKTILENPPKG